MPKLPPLQNGQLAHFLISADGQQLERFTAAGHHQMAVATFTVAGDGWRFVKGGFTWKGLARQRWQDLRLAGWIAI
jgi:hypothetical protein